MWVLSWFGYLNAIANGRFDIIRLRSEAKRRAKQAQFLLIQPWHELLEQSLEEVRQQMQLLPTPVYTPFVSGESEQETSMQAP